LVTLADKSVERIAIRRLGRQDGGLRLPPSLFELRRTARQITFCEIKFSPTDLGERFE
jgi:hypothetical protein